MSETVLVRGTTTVVLFQGYDLDPIADKTRAVETVARSAAVSRLNDADPMADVAREYDDLLAESAERGVAVVLTAHPRKEYRTLLNKHPVRMVQTDDGETTHPDDMTVGFNRETFGDDLVPASMDAEAFGGPAKLDAFLDNLSEGNFSRLYSAAVDLNQGRGPDPKVRLSSLLAQTSDETSTSPERLA